MWYRVTYTKETIRPHIIHKDFLELHHRYILERYAAAPKEVTEVDDILLDPGGMIALATEPITLAAENCMATIKSEHVCVVADYFFNKEIYELVKSAYDNNEADPKLRARFLSEDCMKIYMEYNVLVMSPGDYLNISSKLDEHYISGLETYFNLIEKLSGINEFQELTYYFPNIEPAEA